MDIGIDDREIEPLPDGDGRGGLDAVETIVHGSSPMELRAGRHLSIAAFVPCKNGLKQRSMG
jgi:hypothetical protein